MISVEPYQIGDAALIDIQPIQCGGISAVSCDEQSQCGMAFTVRAAGGGRILMVGGYVEPHSDYAALWGLLALDKECNMIVMTRRLREWILSLPHRVVDCLIEERFDVAKRWAVAIGMTPGPRLIGRMPGGFDAILYERFAS